MKKFLGIVLSVCMLLSMAACGEKTVNSEDKGSSETKVSVEEKVDTTVYTEEKENVGDTVSDDEHEYPYVTKSMGLSAVVEVYKHSEDLSNWGAYSSFGTSDEVIYIKYPSLIPSSGKFVAYQNDGTIVLAINATYGNILEKITDEESIIDVVSNDSEELCSIYKQMTWYIGTAYVNDLSICINKKDYVSVGQFSCCRGEGSLTYSSKKFEGSKTLSFVIYGTFTENGTPFYWVVFDESEDQSLGDIVAQNAERMGYTIASELK